MMLPVPLILVGKTGSWKSGTGNIIIGRSEFRTSTRKCQKGQGSWRGMKITVVNTPVIFDSKDYNEIVQQEVMACIELSRPGPHTLIFVTRVEPYTAEDMAVAKRVWDIFGSESTKHTIILFTCLEDLRGTPLQEYIRKSNNRNLQELIQQCRNRYCGFNNNATGAEQERQVSVLMETVQRTVSENRGSYYINQLYQEPNLRDEHVRTFIEQNRKPGFYERKEWSKFLHW